MESDYLYILDRSSLTALELYSSKVQQPARTIPDESGPVRTVRAGAGAQRRTLPQVRDEEVSYSTSDDSLTTTSTHPAVCLRTIINVSAC